MNADSFVSSLRPKAGDWVCFFTLAFFLLTFTLAPADWVCFFNFIVTTEAAENADNGIFVLDSGIHASHHPPASQQTGFVFHFYLFYFSILSEILRLRSGQPACGRLIGFVFYFCLLPFHFFLGPGRLGLFLKKHDIQDASDGIRNWVCFVK